MTFSSLEQRMAKSYLDLFPGFIPDEKAKIKIAEQEQFYLYFPGYSYCWTNINDDLADQLIEMLSFMDRFIRN